MQTADEIAALLVARYGWSHETLALWIRAGFKCEYCGHDLLASVDDYYYNEQQDHIVPQSKEEGWDGADNLAVVCKTCNFLKRDWDPRSTGPAESPREYIDVVQQYVLARRLQKRRELDEMRALVSQLLAQT